MTAATDTPRQNALYLTPLGPRRALGFGVGSDVVPDANDLTPAAARARWHRVPAETSAPAVAQSPACLAQELGNRPQPQTKRGSPASLESIAHIGTPCLLRRCAALCGLAGGIAVATVLGVAAGL